MIKLDPEKLKLKFWESSSPRVELLFFKQEKLVFEKWRAYIFFADEFWRILTVESKNRELSKLLVESRVSYNLSLTVFGWTTHIITMLLSYKFQSNLFTSSYIMFGSITTLFSLYYLNKKNNYLADLSRNPLDSSREWMRT